ncbi:bifunctional ADP-dependent NAD(P)H-hydrate dehydratase/NAD(P)H-hydrate epimerase, partial [bacterium DOLZORAL124_64_63]
RAGRAMAASLQALYQDKAMKGQVAVVCGKGNNGGDGLVVARLLHEAGLPVAVLMLAEAEELSPDARANYDRLPEGVDLLQPGPEHWVGAAGTLLPEAALVVDAIFGTGIQPPLRAAYVALIQALNGAPAMRVALDIPSGVAGDDGRVDPVAFRADLTITVGLPKRGLLWPPGRDWVGQLQVVDIGFPPDICEKHSPDHHVLEPAEYAALLPERRSDSHKYDHGAVLLLAGSHAYGGAAQLAGLGALRSGAGLVRVAVPAELAPSLRAGLPEAIVTPLAATENGTVAPLPDWVREDLLRKQDAVVLGPGLDADPRTDAWARAFLADAPQALLVDADGLGAFARHGQTPRFAHANVVLTPHVGEMARLIGLPGSEVAADRLALCGRWARRWKVVLLLKGSPTLIGAPDGRVFFNPTGDDALARGGSGDVLAGLIGGLLAQGLTALEAALLGAYLHGRAGSLAAEAGSRRGILVREVAAALGPAYAELERR